jgi:hypothetical protein
VKARALAAGLLLLFPLSSCGSKASVTVSADVEQPMITVGQASALATGLSGTFVLRVELGSVSPSSTDVSVQALSFETQDKSLVLVLKTIANPAGPVHLEPGQQANVTFTLSEGSAGSTAQTISAQQAAQICGSGMALITGGVSDTASGGSTPVASALFAVSGPGCSP